MQLIKVYNKRLVPEINELFKIMFLCSYNSYVLSLSLSIIVGYGIEQLTTMYTADMEAYGAFRTNTLTVKMVHWGDISD